MSPRYYGQREYWMHDLDALKTLLPEVVALAKAAGEAILGVVADADDLGIEKKSDHSPVTRADFAAHHVIQAGLMRLTPTIPIISEEGKHLSFTERRQWSSCWVVDPLDGTKGFIDGSGEYTVNIALVEGHAPVLGVIYSPQLQQCYAAVAGDGASLITADGVRQPIRVRSYHDDRSIHIAVSQYHRSDWLETVLSSFPDHHLVRMNSSIKIAFVASGVADIYPRLGPTSEWDTAAGHCIVEAAGGKLVDLYGQTLQYNARETLTNPAFIVAGDPTQLSRYLEIMQRVRREK